MFNDPTQPFSQSRAFPLIEGRGETFKHAQLSSELAVGLLGLEAEEDGRLLSADLTLRELYPNIRVVLLQYTRGGIEKTSLQFASNEQIFNVVSYSIGESHGTCKTNLGHKVGHPLTHVTFSGPISEGTLGLLIKNLKNAELFPSESATMTSGPLAGVIFSFIQEIDPDNN